MVPNLKIDGGSRGSRRSRRRFSFLGCDKFSGFRPNMRLENIFDF
jgi:hypothetical protein